MRSTVPNEASSTPTSAAISSNSASPGQGRRGGYRTIIVRRAQQRCIFVYGFAKSRKADLTPDELKVYQVLGALLLRYDDKAIKIAIAAKELVEVTHRG